MQLHPPPPQAQVSVRVLWAVARARPPSGDALTVLEAAGFTPQEIANPATRVPRRLLTQVFEEAAATASDPAFGLRAGERMEHGDFDVLEHAARNCATLGDAIRCVGRYFALLTDAAEITLDEQGDKAIWAYRPRDAAPRPAALNDFIVASALTFSRRCGGFEGASLEVHLMHHTPTDPAEYARVFRGAPVRFGMPRNAVVFPRARLALLVRNANAHLQRAFETRAAELSKGVSGNHISGRVREALINELPTGTITMSGVARKLAMSVPTLRRRLADEGTSHSILLETLRYELARRYLDEGCARRDIATRLGYAGLKSFERAYRRWSDDASRPKVRATS